MDRHPLIIPRILCLTCFCQSEHASFYDMTPEENLYIFVAPHTQNFADNNSTTKLLLNHILWGGVIHVRIREISQSSHVNGSTLWKTLPKFNITSPLKNDGKGRRSSAFGSPGLCSRGEHVMLNFWEVCWTDPTKHNHHPTGGGIPPVGERSRPTSHACPTFCPWRFKWVTGIGSEWLAHDGSMGRWYISQQIFHININQM